jgi:cyclopropane-fatty-acyl-phospholipid synthase
MRAKETVFQLLEIAGVRLNGGNPWDIQVHDKRFFNRLLRDKNLGLGEAYMDGWWTCERIDEFILRVLQAQLYHKVRGSTKFLIPYFNARFFNKQSRNRSIQVAREHYNLDNELFMSFLDPYNQYSCAYFANSDDLDRAQVDKMELISKKLNLQKNDRVLDIGAGWGGFAKFIAERYGCSVVANNISSEQIDYARESFKGLPIEILQVDYRDIHGTFSKVVSVGMFEHVGYKNYRSFMLKVQMCLEDHGVFLLHTIGGNEAQVKCDPWMNKYIFPNGMLPGLSQITKAIEGLFVVEDIHNLGPHYDKTLMAWNANFQKAWPQLKEKYDERFRRMWEYYLLSCAGSFRARDMQLWQIVMTKYWSPQPACRHS